MGCNLGWKTVWVGVALSTLGTLLSLFWPSMFDGILRTELALSPNSKSYSFWEDIPIPIYIEFYFFNWTNVQDINNASFVPVLEEVGPYVFRERRVKVVKDWFEHNSTVSYFQNRTWYFEPSMSRGQLDDEICTLNIPAVTAAFSLRHSQYRVERFLLNLAMIGFQTKIWVKKTAREFLFDGYSDPLLDLAKIIPHSIVPVPIPFDKFGWFYARNGSETYDGLFNMFTGQSDIEKFGEIDRWNFTNTTKFYESYCGQVNGSAGEFFPMKQTKKDISLWSPDVCRSLTFNFKEEVEVDGIEGYRYWGDDSMFDNKTSRPDNWCFCPSVPPDVKDECPRSGVANISSCKWGAPAFISFPHFFQADPWYRSTVIGMQPDENLHQSFVDLEPYSGIPIRVAAGLQINILLQPMKEYTILKNVPTIYFPALWFKQTARVDDNIGPQVKLLSRIPSIGSTVFDLILSAGLALIFIVAISRITMKVRNSEDRVILLSTEADL